MTPLVLLLAACSFPRQDGKLGDTGGPADTARSDTAADTAATAADTAGDTADTGPACPIYYRDADGDGFGDADATTRSCDGAPDGYADNGADCDDGDAGVHPGATDVPDGQDQDCDGDVDEDAPVAPTVSVVWDDDGVSVVVAGGTAPAWGFGMAETGAGSAGWFGESCVPGDEPAGYDDYGWDVCHTLGGGGGSLVSVYPEIGDVRDGATLFAAMHDGNLTYVLFDTSSDACWAWGHDPTYYDDLDCAAPQ